MAAGGSLFSMIREPDWEAAGRLSALANGEPSG